MAFLAVLAVELDIVTGSKQYIMLLCCLEKLHGFRFSSIKISMVSFWWNVCKVGGQGKRVNKWEIYLKCSDI